MGIIIKPGVSGVGKTENMAGATEADRKRTKARETTDVFNIGGIVEELLLESPHGEDTKIAVHCEDGFWYVTRIGAD